MKKKNFCDMALVINVLLRPTNARVDVRLFPKEEQRVGESFDQVLVSVSEVILRSPIDRSERRATRTNARVRFYP